MVAADLGMSLLSKLLSDFYRKSNAYFPDRIEEREFGVGDLVRKIAFRHMQFKSNDEFRKYMIANAPPYVSCSSAYYHFPAGRPMSAKGWTGSELIFDLDANDMHLDCQKIHGGAWVCDNCLERVKDETFKLIEDFLMPDFGFSDNEIMVNFSGNRGYHVHVKSDVVMKLDTDARKEVSDYIAGHGIDFEQMGIEKSIARKLYEKRALVEMGIRNGNWDMVYIKNKTDFWKSVIEKQAVAQSDRIDKNVTNDTGHMIRLAGSIHGGSGLIIGFELHVPECYLPYKVSDSKLPLLYTVREVCIALSIEVGEERRQQ